MMRFVFQQRAGLRDFANNLESEWNHVVSSLRLKLAHVLLHVNFVGPYPLPALLLMCLLSKACIVTDSFEFEDEENFPPSIESAPSAADAGTSLGEIVQFRVGDPVIDPSVDEEKRFPVLVRDPNLSQEVAFRVFVDFRAEFPGSGGALLSGRLPPSGELVREFEFTITQGQLPLGGANTAVGCHKVELLVSGDFREEGVQREPVQPGDIGTAVWWLYTTDENTTSVDFITCP